MTWVFLFVFFGFCFVWYCVYRYFDIPFSNMKLFFFIFVILYYFVTGPLLMFFEETEFDSSSPRNGFSSSVNSIFQQFNVLHDEIEYSPELINSYVFETLHEVYVTFTIKNSHTENVFLKDVSVKSLSKNGYTLSEETFVDVNNALLKPNNITYITTSFQKDDVAPTPSFLPTFNVFSSPFTSENFSNYRFDYQKSSNTIKLVHPISDNPDFSFTPQEPFRLIGSIVLFNEKGTAIYSDILRKDVPLFYEKNQFDFDFTFPKELINQFSRVEFAVYDLEKPYLQK